MSEHEVKRHIAGPLSAEVIERDLERCRAARRAEGLPEHLEDPVVLDRIAAIVSSNWPRPAS